MKDEVIDVLCICSAIQPIFLVDHKQESYGKSELRKAFAVPLPHIRDYSSTTPTGGNRALALSGKGRYLKTKPKRQVRWQRLKVFKSSLSSLNLWRQDLRAYG